MRVQEIRLLLGDSFDLASKVGPLAALVADPPYGLFFMGKEFDDLGEGAAQQEWHRQWLTLVYQALIPGGVVKAFGGARTFHRLAAAMAQVGFQDIRLEAWTYGCLSEDTEILTSGEWVHYHKTKIGTPVLG